ncbi:hypothetical protein AAC387_Pa10g1099 [Persea americana]
MEVSVVRCSQTSVGKVEFSPRKLGFCNSMQICPKSKRIGFDLTRRWKMPSVRVALKAIRSDISRSEAVVDEKAMRKNSPEKPDDCVRLFVGLPLDCYSQQNARAIAVGLKALKLLGVEGVELPMWWGIVEKEGPCKYDWSSYLSLAKMVQDVGLKLHVSLGFHATEDRTAALPQWVSRIGETQPDIFFTDHSGRRYKKCLSLAVDDLPVLEGRTLMQVYEQFFESFRSSFADFMGSTITDVSVGLGPGGELRYPSFPLKNKSQIPAVGEFQCYDKHMLAQLKQHAEAAGKGNWGLSGPHDAPRYDDSPDSNGFMREIDGSWETQYGDFFLSWYSNQLISHGDRLLSLASRAFGDSLVTVSARVPLMHSWYKTRSHPSELTAGFYNTATRDGYGPVAEMFAKNSCKMIIPGMDLSDEYQPKGSQSSPESLLSQIMNACKGHGVHVSGENSLASSTSSGFGKIKDGISSSEDGLASFTYQRMGAYFFSPEHWPLFAEFVRSLDRIELHLDDLPDNGARVPSSTAASEQINDRHMQAV